MNLDITFGWHLDGPSYPEVMAAGKLAVGPIGMTNQLALRLGLLAPFPAPAVRIAEYMSRLGQLDDGTHFYSQSFQTDPWGTARALLFLRDELIEAGWKPVVNEGASQRIQMLARIENLVEGDRKQKDLFCLSDLLSRIAETLEAGDRRVPIRSITFLDERSTLPPIWQRIFRRLEKNGVLLHNFTPIEKNGDSDLERTAKFLSENLVEGNSRETTTSLAGDNTLVVLESDDEVQAADYVCEFLKNACSQSEMPGTDDSSSHPDDIAIIRGGSTSFLDHFLRKNNLPILGGSDSSPLRGFMLLLPMALELCWKPFDPARLIEFLMLPHCPVPKYIASAFISALKSEPGIGGGAWQRAWQIALERKQKVLENGDHSARDNGSPEVGDKPLEPAIENSLLEAELNWKAWLEPQLVDPSTGMPKETVASICRQVQLHAVKLHKTVPASGPYKTNEVFIATAAYAETLSRAVELCREETIPRSQLHRMIESVMDDGYRADAAEASPWINVDHPGQIYGPVDTLVWWGFISDKNHMRTSPWTSAELSYLCQQGVEPEHPQSATIREAKSWRRPIDGLARRVLFVAPRTVAGSPTSSHPFFHEITELIEASSPAARNRIIRQAHQIYQQPESGMFDTRIKREIISGGSLTQPRPIWKIAPDAVRDRRESPSSLERLLACPMSWLMRFRAGLKSGNLLSMTQGEQLAGNLAHAIFAQVFSRDDSIGASDIEHTAAETFDRLCPNIAAPLMLPGNSLERQRLRKAIIDGAAKLAILLKDAGFSAVRCESSIEAEHDGVSLFGRSDMYLIHPDNQDCVIDLKWTKRSSSYRRRELVEGRAIQLAVYSALYACQSGHRTEAGYYMISQKQLLSTSENPFPSHSHVSGPTLTATFAKVLANYKKHMSHLAEGTVYATGLAQPQDELFESQRPLIIDDDHDLLPVQIPEITLALEPPCKICDYGRLCGKKEFGS